MYYYFCFIQQQQKRKFVHRFVSSWLILLSLFSFLFLVASSLCFFELALNSFVLQYYSMLIILFVYCEASFPFFLPYKYFLNLSFRAL